MNRLLTSFLGVLWPQSPSSQLYSREVIRAAEDLGSHLARHIGYSHASVSFLEGLKTRGIYGELYFAALRSARQACERSDGTTLPEAHLWEIAAARAEHQQSPTDLTKKALAEAQKSAYDLLPQVGEAYQEALEKFKDPLVVINGGLVDQLEQKARSAVQFSYLTKSGMAVRQRINHEVARAANKPLVSGVFPEEALARLRSRLGQVNPAQQPKIQALCAKLRGALAINSMAA